MVVVIWLVFMGYAWKSGFITVNPPKVENPSSPVVVKPKQGIEISNVVVSSSQSQVLAPDPDDKLHIIFSTDCNPFQDWQTLLLFYSAKTINQRGSITRIASGCDDEKKAYLTELYQKLYPNYHVHFTPDFKLDEKTQRKCKYCP